MVKILRLTFNSILDALLWTFLSQKVSPNTMPQTLDHIESLQRKARRQFEALVE
jgi:hypothetical protein